MRARWVVGPRSRARHAARRVGDGWYPICGADSVRDDESRTVGLVRSKVSGDASVLDEWVCPDCRRTISALAATVHPEEVRS